MEKDTAILAIYWRGSNYDVLLAGDEDKVKKFSGIDVNDSIDLYNLMHNLNKEFILQVVVNKDSTRKNWVEFVTDVYLINTEIAIKTVTTDKKGNASDVLVAFLNLIK